MSKTNVVPFVPSELESTIPPLPQQEESPTLSREALLHHYVQEGVQVLQGLDNLGNFLMGFGVLVLGYLLNAQLKPHVLQSFTQSNGGVAMLSWLCLGAWTLAVVLLLRFMYWFIFHLLAGRAVYASQNQANSIGERIELKRMTYQQYQEQAPNFDSFVQRNYLEKDQNEDKQLWFATFRYTRYVALRKLMIMNRMRSLLAWALWWGLVFKLADIGVGILL
ncbi:MAG: hypothetical protein EP343_31760 [Deltaproteobacteria bacterium]|nr:MAG: hypothetical protein EP343_31760 [Deltaproteobacteria bacterium]